MNKKKLILIELLSLRFPETEKKKLLGSILCGEVLVNHEKVRDAKRLVDADAVIGMKCKEYVSRGGIKLAHVLEKWHIDVRGRVFIDAGCSTGGFTDCLLQHGARFVHAVDVGHNQLAYTLRKDSHVKVYEKTNILSLNRNDIDPKPDAAVCDLSFRSVSGAASHLLDLVSGDLLIALVKPQFEWESPDPTFHGVITSGTTIVRVCERLIEKLSGDGVKTADAELSPITGAKGNREIFFLLRKKSKELPEKIIGKIILQL